MKTYSTFLLPAMGVIALAASNNFFGSINTSTIDGTVVNQNLFNSKDDVYLNGGPQNQNANGLPDGVYYFRVTDPSGATVLSTDNAICRQLTVASGKVAGATGPCQHEYRSSSSRDCSVRQ